ncbi:hypothetical protein KBY99_08300 [Cyanobium sp. Maggiore-St4-Cus]|uniref:hypothetical protein n=1 Tax=Cyanobium sp. Maggiore-St4-Cus TaxID=2823717 RepID=UPI0020CBDF8B|nr:hypothetical protein [Cyanobium sp. Maggiore-St4-Cus]MCP9788981.1 hypothetical protein [Cyanobium sp. Maggiore-St4-Cus]
MSTSPSSAPSPSISKSEFYSSLPWFRRLLATLNWRPVVDYELREIEFDRREIEFEKRKRQLESEDAQLRKDDEQRKIEHEQRMKQLKSENERLAELNAKLSAILFSSDTSSTPPNATPGESEM